MARKPSKIKKVFASYRLSGEAVAKVKKAATQTGKSEAWIVEQCVLSRAGHVPGFGMSTGRKKATVKKKAVRGRKK